MKLKLARVIAVLLLSILSRSVSYGQSNTHKTTLKYGNLVNESNCSKYALLHSDNGGNRPFACASVSVNFIRVSPFSNVALPQYHFLAPTGNVPLSMPKKQQ